ncbi:hypothetical protein LCGC14_2137130 [marine sediment metagenome]|uniref:Uncharacterized protein n=1 Tax=marine sediment metagenome TaxID=412755 RepID=A0A0F9DZJ9_9ZZZZ
MSEEIKKEAEGEEQKKADADSTEGDESKTISELDRADQIAERQKRENDRREELLQREENLEARRKVGGITEAGKPAEKPKELTDTEYSEALERGEVNPLKEDGLI